MPVNNLNTQADLTGRMSVGPGRSVPVSDSGSESVMMFQVRSLRRPGRLEFEDDSDVTPVKFKVSHESVFQALREPSKALGPGPADPGPPQHTSDASRTRHWQRYPENRASGP
jgi:hypothetical protein